MNKAKYRKTYGFYFLPVSLGLKFLDHRKQGGGCAIWSADWHVIIGRLCIYKANMLTG